MFTVLIILKTVERTHIMWLCGVVGGGAGRPVLG
jgi:hypothetical protein